VSGACAIILAPRAPARRVEPFRNGFSRLPCQPRQMTQGQGSGRKPKRSATSRRDALQRHIPCQNSCASPAIRSEQCSSVAGAPRTSMQGAKKTHKFAVVSSPNPQRSFQQGTALVIDVCAVAGPAAAPVCAISAPSTCRRNTSGVYSRATYTACGPLLKSSYPSHPGP
jgi:hypothetical protein